MAEPSSMALLSRLFRRPTRLRTHLVVLVTLAIVPVLIFAGVIVLPYLRPGRFERLRLAIDATAGTLSLAVIMWVTYLADVVSLGSDPVETFLNVTYPSADIP